MYSQKSHKNASAVTVGMDLKSALKKGHKAFIICLLQVCYCDFMRPSICSAAGECIEKTYSENCNLTGRTPALFSRGRRFKFFSFTHTFCTHLFHQTLAYRISTFKARINVEF